MPFPFEATESVAHARRILESHARVVGRPLLDVDGGPLERARALYSAPWVVLAHGAGGDPVFTYGNAAAQTLFEFEWDELLRVPSRLSAEVVNQAERQLLLDVVSRQGYIDDYAGIRISRTGRRFRIENATVWNLIDEDGQCSGQAATFATWTAV